MTENEFEQVYIANYRYVRAYVRRYVPDAETAEDIAQQAFLKLALSSGVRTPRNYLFSIVRHLVTDYHRAHHELHLDAPVPSPDPPVEEQAARIELRQWIHAGLCQLLPRHRQVLYLRYWLDLNEPEAAAELGLSRDALNQLAHRARVKMKEVLK